MTAQVKCDLTAVHRCTPRQMIRRPSPARGSDPPSSPRGLGGRRVNKTRRAGMLSIGTCRCSCAWKNGTLLVRPARNGHITPIHRWWKDEEREMRVLRSGIVRVCGVAFALLAGALVTAQAPQDQFAPITEQRLRSPADGDWLGYRRTYDVTAFSPLKQINRANVALPAARVGVHGARQQPLGRDADRGERADVRRRGQRPRPRVRRRDRASSSGRTLRTFPEDIATSEAFPRHRGVAIYRDKVYWGTADSFLVALDAQDRQAVWEVKTGDYTTGEGHNHPPLIADGKVFIGNDGRRLRGARQGFRRSTPRPASCCGRSTRRRRRARPATTPGARSRRRAAPPRGTR